MKSYFAQQNVQVLSLLSLQFLLHILQQSINHSLQLHKISNSFSVKQYYLIHFHICFLIFHTNIHP